MSSKNIFVILLLLNLIILSLSMEKVFYDNEKLENMDTYFWNSLDSGFHYLTEELIPKDHKIIAFSDLDKPESEEKYSYTNIITYVYDNTSHIFSFYNHIYDKKNFKFIHNEKRYNLFNMTTNGNLTIRNLYVGIFSGEQCYIITFNNNENKDLTNYIKCEDRAEENLNINSNILIMNNDENGKRKILYYDGHERKICKLNLQAPFCNDPEKIKLIADGKCNQTDHTNTPILADGGLAYLDLDGNGSPDIVLTSQNNDGETIIEIYTSNRKKITEYCHVQDINIGKTEDFGAFTISQIIKNKDKNYAPQFDILIPCLKNNTIFVLENKIHKEYDWEDNYCREVKGEDEGLIMTEPFFEEKKEIEFEDYNKNFTFNNSHFTVIRPGYFLSKSHPGIMIKQSDNNNDNHTICLYQLNDNNKFELSLVISEDKVHHIGMPEYALFFDLNEVGSLSLIVHTVDGKNHFFYNYRKNVYFLKSKVMNDKTNHSDSNLGASFRYIVTDSNGDRHMALSYQLAQTSDMNAPLPYSFVGLGDTNNYVENFQIISGNYIYNNKDNEKEKFEDPDNKNFMKYSPIIPNTQMMIFKFKNSDGKYEWLIELIVQPMDKVLVLALIMLAVMLALLGVIIFLHVREVREEQKETNKFKSWFA